MLPLHDRLKALPTLQSLKALIDLTLLSIIVTVFMLKLIVPAQFPLEYLFLLIIYDSFFRSIAFILMPLTLFVLANILHSKVPAFRNWWDS